MKKRSTKKEVDVNLYAVYNPGDDAGTTELLQMFYRGAYTNSVGIMRALNTSTNKTYNPLSWPRNPRRGTQLSWLRS